MTLVVLGSINIDLVVEAPRLPLAGETLRGTHFHTSPGGKGANQAVAAARQGASVRMVGSVGDDDWRRFLYGLVPGNLGRDPDEPPADQQRQRPADAMGRGRSDAQASQD